MRGLVCPIRSISSQASALGGGHGVAGMAQFVEMPPGQTHGGAGAVPELEEVLPSQARALRPDVVVNVWPQAIVQTCPRALSDRAGRADSSASTSSTARLTRPGTAGQGGPHGGNQP